MKRRGFLTSLSLVLLGSLGFRCHKTLKEKLLEAIDRHEFQPPVKKGSTRMICIGKRPVGSPFCFADDEQKNYQLEEVPLDQLEKKNLSNGYWYWTKKGQHDH